MIACVQVERVKGWSSVEAPILESVRFDEEEVPVAPVLSPLCQDAHVPASATPAPLAPEPRGLA
jgi:hypothetical protein